VREPAPAASGRRLPRPGPRSVVWLLAFFAVLSGLGSCHGTGAHPALAMSRYLLAAERAWNFRGAVLVARGDELVFSGGYGYADAAGTVQNTAATRFSIGSVTKTFTAAAILRLRDEGLLKLDDPVADYVPEYGPPGAAGVTLRRLLSHAAGVPDIAAAPRDPVALTEPRTPLELLASFKDRPLDFEPGTRSRYSNAGYVLLGLAVERVAGMPYPDYVKDRLLAPLEMAHTSYGVDASARDEYALGLVEGPDGLFREASRFHPSLGYSAGGLYSSVEDLRTWVRGLEGGGILTQDSWADMTTAQEDGFGLGWLVMKTWDRKDVAHGGGAPGYDAWIELWPEDGIFVAVLSNSGGAPVGEIGRSLAAVLLEKKVQEPEARRAVPADPRTVGEYAGTYEIGPGNRREILIDGDRLFVRRDDGPRFPILSAGPDLFVFPNDKGATLRFVRDRSGRISGQVFHQLGLDETAAKVHRSDRN
jgi:CubicO group peptidase (beta-lactamase class C family)